MKFTRKIIIIGLLILSISGVLLIGALTQENQQIAETRKIQTKIVDFPIYSKSGLPLELEKNLDFETPDEVPLISFSIKKISKEEIINIAKAVGFNEKFSTDEDLREGAKYSWEDMNYYLYFTPKKSHIKYGMNEFRPSVENYKYSDDDLKRQALDFMINKFGFSEEEIMPVSVEYLQIAAKSEGFSEGLRDEARLFQINLTYKDAGFPVYTTTPNAQIIFVSILPNGEIYKAEAYLLNNIEKTEKKYQTKNLNDVKSSLDEAHMVSLQNDYLNFYSFDNKRVKNIDIQKLQIGYYFNNFDIDITLKPIYLLEGKIEIEDSTADWAKLYMPALKQ